MELNKTLIIIIKFIWYIPRRLMMFLIFLYQNSLSLDHGPLKNILPYGFCKFHPSCSEYSYQSFKKKGFIIGFILTIWRILRCNPWSKGGHDPVK